MGSTVRTASKRRSGGNSSLTMVTCIWDVMHEILTRPLTDAERYRRLARLISDEHVSRVLQEMADQAEARVPENSRTSSKPRNG